MRGKLLASCASFTLWAALLAFATAAEPVVPTPLPQATTANNDEAQSNLLQQQLAEKVAELDRLRAEVDQLSVAAGSPRQFVLNVEIMEVSLSKLRELHVSFRTGPGGLILPGHAEELLQRSYTATGPVPAAAMQNDALEDLISLLKENNMAKTLASPTLVTTSGRPASFQVGGEFPIPAAGGAAVAVEYREFGEQLEVLAESLGGNRVRLEINARLSELDESHAMEIQGQRVPSLRVQQWVTGCEAALGETVALGGLSQKRVESRKLDGGRVEEVTHEIATWVVVRAEDATDAGHQPQ